ncbi:TPA: restriction endonuclease subunit S [Campylobacter jejuni]|uniref:restriction endonuclease subunit S n=1 Tax=Campylobacter jejuni TaxID=197 RepID=UPI00126ED50E|nr:restriction endonuclease subunit S [Campylobacter jejuni]HEE9547555.1 restriction endonuclease subunit S [Campylobacter jejuni subsp. jejuni]HEF9824696.1 restriction endonuclease subunit S [Campylobacter coli]EAH8594890.1 restriction endonuclease subunit S [Campylobacter jejuni]EAI5646381.1 restriction endonuclease subunit S [Campylobacter jejuni]EAK0490105.1 restriction endonuclease subunit S [Campylobacter jejuni]
MTNLPQGWEVKTLSEIGEIITGSTPSKSNVEFYGKDYPFFKPSDFEQGYFLENAGDNLSKLGFGKARQLPPKTILVVCIGSLGKVALTRVIGSCNQQINAIIPHKNIISEYIYYYCISSKFQSILFSKAPQTTLAIFNKTEFSKLEIIYPKDIKKQERIVGILDESFAKIDESIKILEQNLLNLDELMQSALQKAFNPLKDNAKENYKLPQGWEWKSLGEIGNTSSGGTPLRNKKEYWENGSIKWLKSGELNDGYIDFIEENITEEAIENSSAKIFQKGTLLIAMYGATAGRLGILNLDSATNQAVCAFLHKDNKNIKFLEKFLFYFLFFIRDKIIKDSFGGAQPNISQTYIKNLQIPLPPLKEQEQIAKHLDFIFEKTKALKELYTKELKDYEELKQSLLDKAFKGEL